MSFDINHCNPVWRSQHISLFELSAILLGLPFPHGSYSSDFDLCFRLRDFLLFHLHARDTHMSWLITCHINSIATEWTQVSNVTLDSGLHMIYSHTVYLFTNKENFQIPKFVTISTSTSCSSR